MNTETTTDPILSEFETAEQESRHTAWIRAELERRENDSRPSIPHDEIVHRVRTRLDLGHKQKAG